jgi:ParB-like chromosome segregation protein Spo0J
VPDNDKGVTTIERLAQRLESLSVEYAAIGSFRANPWNPNRQNAHEFKMLKMSIEDAGFTQPIMVVEVLEQHADEWQPELAQGYRFGDLVIVDGEHRWRAAADLGMDTIPYVVMPYGAAQARLSTLQMNRARGSEDLNLAAEVLRDLERLGVLAWAGSRLDMSDDELGRMLSDIEPVDVLPGDQHAGVDEHGEVHTTPLAARADRDYQAAVAQAKTQEERAAAAAGAHTFRLVLTFDNDEADIVRNGLGADPPATVLGWCRAGSGLPRSGINGPPPGQDGEAVGHSPEPGDFTDTPGQALPADTP